MEKSAEDREKQPKTQQGSTGEARNHDPNRPTGVRSGSVREVSREGKNPHPCKEIEHPHSREAQKGKEKGKE